MNEILSQALRYLELGLCVIPLRPKDKKPCFAWKEFETRRPTEEELYRWFDGHPDLNLGIVCGAISGNLIAVDIDGPDGLDWAQKNLPTPAVSTKTPKSDCTWHWFYLGEGVRNGKPHPQIDIRGNGGYVVAPPSIHPNGGQYALCIADGSEGWSELRPISFTQVGLDLRGVKTQATTEPVAVGSRNQTLAQLVGKWCAKGNDIDDIMMLAEAWNARNRPPLAAIELNTTVRSIISTHNRNHPGSMVTAADSDLPDIDLDEPAKVPFPEELLNPGGLLQRIMDYTEASNAASVPLFALAGAIAIMGTVAGFKVQGETKLKTNFYLVSLGPSGTGKNAVCSTIPTILANAARSTLGPTELASAAAILRHLQPPEQRITLICADEIGMLLKGLRFPESPKSEIPALLTKLFSACDRPNLKSFADAKLNLAIPFHCLSVYGASTHVEFWKGIHFDDASNGFLARILLFDYTGRAPRPKENIDMRIPHELIADLEAIWKITPPPAPGSGNIDRIPQPFTIPFSDEARWLWKPWKEKWFDIRESAIEEPAKAAIYNRVVEHGWKLALVHAVSTQGAAIINGGMIDYESVVWATSLIERLAADMIRNISDRVSDNEWHSMQKRIISIIRRIATPEKPGASARELKKLSPMPPRQFDEIMASLEQSGKIHRRSFKCDRGPETAIFCVSKDRSAK